MATTNSPSGPHGDDYARHGGSPARSPDEGSFTLLSVVGAVLKWRRFILASVIGLAATLGMQAYIAPTYYRAAALFSPGDADATTNTFAEFGQRFGLSVPNVGSGSLDYYARVLTTREILDSAVTSEYAIPAPERTAFMDLIEYFEVIHPDEDVRLRKARDQLRGRIDTEVHRPSGLIQVAVSMPAPELAEQVAQRLLEVLNRFNLDRRQSRAETERRFIADRLADTESRLTSAEDSLLNFMQTNRRIEESPTLLFESQRLTRRVQYHQDIYTSLQQAYEKAGIESVRNTPVISIVESPEGSARREREPVLFKAALGGGLGLILACLLAVSAELFRRSETATPFEREQFQRIRAETVADIRRPLEWLRRAFGRSRQGK